MSAADIRAMAEAIYNDLLADSVLSTTIEAHREIKRGQVVCATCGTRCRAHVPINPIASGQSSAAASREASPIKVPSTRPNGYTVGPEKGTGGGTGIGSGSGRVDASGNAFFDCLVCGRSITSSRYAPHLASCLGYSGSTRRGASRMAAAKARLGANDRASPSPYLASDIDSDADSNSGKRKKLNGSLAKRAASPTKVFKKKHMAHSGSAPPASKPHPPSRLGRPPIKAHSASPYSPDSKPGKTASPAPSFRASASAAAAASAARESSVASSARAGSVGSAGSGVGSGASGTSAGTANTGTRGGKTLPGMNNGPGVSGQVSRQGSAMPEHPGDESSEADDDY
ncbi:uncharacterized protein EHS24_000374 [Apiotrichum porosum]|uniref:SAGA-associated factor 11 n=1 Tax=Apiotrichum porosum TaxID=105984 RepID=A0A427Y9U8_9TREE|nr:uncharacterized protein EHS24_000374 [Apiotrichum porosum]RSH87856.1 hypothetical protein EHS24_000374 [Apiotrichum porosum]